MKNNLELISDGTAAGTVISINGKPIDGVTGVELLPLKADKLVELRITTYVNRVTLSGTVTHIYRLDHNPSRTAIHAPAVNSVWKHRNGTEYTVLFLTNEDSARPEYPLTVVYQGPNAKVWSRPACDWHRSMTLK